MDEEEEVLHGPCMGQNGDINENEEDEEAAGIDLQELEKRLSSPKRQFNKLEKIIDQKGRDSEQQQKN